jgi:4-amino-4-deoxy-L-arabinose transferase-like glycosyltransferase
MLGRDPRLRLALGGAVLLLGLLLSLYVSTAIFERIPHNEDELAFLYQAKVFAGGALSAPSPPEQGAFFAPFVLDQHGRRFAKYPPGYSLLLAPGAAFGLEWLVNPLLGAGCLLVILALGWRYYGFGVGLTAAALGALSPFFLEFAGSLMSHTATLFALLLAIWCYAHALDRASWRGALLAGVFFGVALTERPVTAVGVGLPFALYAVWLALHGRLRRFSLPLAVGAAPWAPLLVLYNWAQTGTPRLSLYELWWPFDRYGFGEGIGTLGRHTPQMGEFYLKLNVAKLTPTLLGWPLADTSTYFLCVVEAAAVLLLLVAAGRRGRPLPLVLEALLLASCITLPLAYVPYWAPDARYYYEALGGFLLLTALGARRLFGLARPFGLVRFAVPALLVGLTLAGSAMFTPGYLGALYGKNHFTRARLDAVRDAGLHNALVLIVQQYDWSDYGSVAPANDPWLRGDVVYALANDDAMQRTLAHLFPERQAYVMLGTELIPLR